MRNPPSFAFYPQDFLSDVNVRDMTMRELGAYIVLLCNCWIEDGIPVDSRVVQGWLKPGSIIAKCFYEKDGVYRNKRLDLERQRQINWREKSRLGGLHAADNKRTIKGGARVVKPPFKPSLLSSPSSIKKGFKKNLSVRYLELAQFLEGKIKENVPHHKFQGRDYLTSWAHEFMLMETRDKIPLDAIKAVLEWSQQDSFWKINILSASKFREKFGRLEAKAQSGGNGRGEHKASQVGKNREPIDPKVAASMKRSAELRKRLWDEAEARGDKRPRSDIEAEINLKVAQDINAGVTT
jgi:uncharacterized protein YdaU (DUF1376 family)